jgi:hypothetical protein
MPQVRRYFFKIFYKVLIILAFRQKAGEAASLYLVEKTHVTRFYFCTPNSSGLLIMREAVKL